MAQLILMKGLWRAGAVVVDGAGEKALAGPGVAGDENRRVRAGKFFQAVDHLLDRRAFRNDHAEIVDDILFAAQIVNLVLHLPLFDGPLHNQLDSGRGEGLADKIISALLDGLDNQFSLVRFAGYDDWGERQLLTGMLQQGKPGLVIGCKVQDDDVVMIFADFLLIGFRVVEVNHPGCCSQGLVHGSLAVIETFVGEKRIFGGRHGSLSWVIANSSI